MHIGNVPERYTIALDLTAFSGNIEHEAGDLTVFADAGVTIEDLSKTLAKQGQRLPFDVPEPEKATLGGSVASDAPGQMRTSLGGIRDWVIGMKVVLADGTVTKSGGRVVKNVQGYDLHKLHTGAFGTLGVIAEVALKVVPLPASSSTVAAWFASAADAGDYAMQLFNGPVVPEALTVFAGAAAEAGLAKIGGSSEDFSPALVLARVTGGKAAVSRMERDLTGTAGTTGAAGYEVVRGKDADKLWGKAVVASTGDGLSMRTTLKPRDAVKVLDQSASNSATSEGFSGELHAGFGTISISEATSGTRSDIDRFVESVTRLGGHAVIERCPIELKREIDVFGEQGEALAVMKSIKQRFDPDRILNPGRFTGRI